MTIETIFPSVFSLSTPATAKASRPRVRHGRWSAEEQALFERAFAVHGKEWRLIADELQTRTVVQVRTHAQKYFQRVAKETNTPVMSTSNKPRFQPLPLQLTGHFSLPFNSMSSKASNSNSDCISSNFGSNSSFKLHYSPSSTVSDSDKSASSALSIASVSSASVVSSVSASNVTSVKQTFSDTNSIPVRASKRLNTTTCISMNIENDKKEIQRYLQKGTEEEVLAAAFLLSSVSNSPTEYNKSNSVNTPRNKRKRGNSDVSDYKLQWADGVLSTVY